MADEPSAAPGAPARGAPYRDRLPSPEEGKTLIWYRVPGMIASISMALSTGVLLAVASAGINAALGLETRLGPHGDGHAAYGERMHFIAFFAMLLGYPLLLPAVYRFAGREVGPGKCPPSVTGGALIHDAEVLALYRPDNRTFGYDAKALQAAAAAPTGSIYIGGILKVPALMWNRAVGVYLIAGLVSQLFISLLMRIWHDVPQMLILPFYVLSPLFFGTFDSWRVYVGGDYKRLRFASWIPWHPGMRVAIERIRDTLRARLARSPWWRWS